MLKLEFLAQADDVLLHFAKFDPMSSTWLVSDLRSKLYLQKKCIQNEVFLPGDSFLRASELWRKILLRVRPELQVISREFALTLIGDHMSRLTSGWARSPGAPQTAYQYLTQLMPLLSHVESYELMQTWFTENEESHVRWGHWYELCRELWSIFLQEGFVVAPWISGVLVNEPGLEEVWGRDLYVELGAELNQIESELLIRLSKKNDVTVFVPNPVWRKDFAKTLWAYDHLIANIPNLKWPAMAAATVDSKNHGEFSDVKNSKIGRKKFKKMTTMLGEVKEAIVQVREWLEQGTSATEISIVAPDIEVYWPVLRPYLEIEGIPVNKDLQSQLHTFLDFSRWLAQMRMQSGSVDEVDLELVVFDQNPVLSFERFRVLFSHIYDQRDFSREVQIEKIFSQTLSQEALLSRDEFVAWSLKWAASEATELPQRSEMRNDMVNVERLEILFKRFLAEVPESARLQLRQWLNYLQQLASRIDVVVDDAKTQAKQDGVNVVSIGSAQASPASKIVMMGLTEPALRSHIDTSIVFADVLSIRHHTGFQMFSADQSKLAFEAKWVMHNERREYLLMVPETDFSGSVQAPAWMWLEGAIIQDPTLAVSIPQKTRWDDVQQAGLSVIGEIRGWSETRSNILAKALRWDMGEEELPLLQSVPLSQVSASGLEAYLECPFVFAATRLFRLSDDPVLDLDVDAATRGRLMHAILQNVIHKSFNPAISDAELDGIFENIRKEKKLEFGEEKIWLRIKQQNLELLKKVIAFEIEWRKNWPETQTEFTELRIQGFLDLTTGELSTDEREGTLRVSGSIDRVDVDKAGRAVIIDYKSSANSLSQFGSWLANDQLQLLFYSQALEHGLGQTVASELGASAVKREVVGAFYYVPRSLNREMGFKVTDQEQNLFSADDRKKNKLSKIEKEKLIGQLNEKVADVVQHMKRGYFQAIPKDKKTCTTCQWSLLCRAPHLSK